MIIKLSIIIKKYFRDDFCTLFDFYWYDRESMKKCNNIVKQWLLVILFYFIATIFCIGYYLLLPFRLLHEWCESWCY